MNLLITFRANWKDRKQSVDECADRVHDYFSGLASIDESFSKWYQPGRSLKDSLSKEFKPNDRLSTIKLLEKGRNRYDVGKGVIEDLGFSLHLWNGSKDEDGATSLRLLCGAYNKFVANEITIDFSKNLSCDDALAEKTKALISLTCSIWQPDWAGAMSNEALKLRSFPGHKPFVDWMVYVPRPIGRVPFPATSTRLENGGTLIVTQPQPPLPEDPEALKQIHYIEELISWGITT